MLKSEFNIIYNLGALLAKIAEKVFIKIVNLKGNFWKFLKIFSDSCILRELFCQLEKQNFYLVKFLEFLSTGCFLKSQ